MDGDPVVETTRQKLKYLNDIEPYAMNKVKQIVKMVTDLRVTLGENSSRGRIYKDVSMGG